MQGQRIFGLDAMRAVAIALVVMWHSWDALQAAVPGLGYPLYVDGVDLFFVLSGYLVGGILLNTVVEGRSGWPGRLLDFWQRRWLRTLPNYYLFLLVNVVLVALGFYGGVLNRNTWGYALFLQNVWKHVDLFFWESWSLVVEEWFYLLFPLLVALLSGLMKPQRAFRTVLLAMLVAPTIVRFAMADGVASLWHLEQGVRKLVMTRLDAIGFGVLAVLLHRLHPAAWARWRYALLVPAFAGVLANALAYGTDHLRYSSTWYYTVNGLAMAALLPALSLWTRRPLLGAPVEFLSRISYALYLVHQPLRYLFNRYVFGTPHDAGVASVALYWALSIMLAWLVYRWWERPFMALRDRMGRWLAGLSLPGSRP
jgi:peptidoglycan/LPS O-acetylase OafA/YrhL